MTNPEMQIIAFAVEGDEVSWQIIMPSGAQIVLKFELDSDGSDAVHDFINHLEPKIKAHMQEREWIPSSDGFTPDRKDGKQ